ncbi:hypothetical protein [Owenweeksia hongkongensis]|uniref:Uncharacterized protein n=1 Tax=Owenweeksia hongkongensis (strain DSM 17368 / CIP 108786 / JCM 12287 / NRRL B-23963 / UST20020801) TaxID=926562 RepID=G8R573_OWEHD|nr:hypothetical protein [Owenweeksia hongkongensis]AEV32118.1 hypothetical protein Oweho_1112 [Owenweeksia hongkongensis DSM 17368]
MKNENVSQDKDRAANQPKATAKKEEKGRSTHSEKSSQNPQQDKKSGTSTSERGTKK